MYDQDKIKKNWDDLNKHVRELTDREIRIIAVTKRHPEHIYDVCVNLGIKEIGENRIQELLGKNEAKPEARKKLKVHLIGPLQTNKVKFLAGNVDSMDTISSIDTILKINERWNLPEPLSALLQINSTDEVSKAGLHYEEPEKIFQIAKACLESPKLKLEGLLTMGPTPDGSYDRPDEKYVEDTRKAFLRVRDLRDELQSIFGIALPRLSMGMTHDYDIAIECGSTEVRIGSLLFGERL